MASSPPQHVPSSPRSRRVKKPPPITPKRFTRFFAPRSIHGSAGNPPPGTSGRQLRDLTQGTLNRRSHGLQPTPRKTVNFCDAAMAPPPETPRVADRKRKTPYLSPESSPAQPSPSKRSKVAHPKFTILEDEGVDQQTPQLDIIYEEHVFPEPVKKLRGSNLAIRTLQRSFGGMRGVGRGFLQDHGSSWQHSTANFSTSPEDLFQLPRGSPPFCTASCNENSLVAVGDEDGCVHLLDTDDTASFNAPHLSFRAHENAIMDLQFSSDDKYLAIGSGDQSARIFDVLTQKCIASLQKHLSSVKQVRYQPGNDNVVATSSRDGVVHVWDLRCSGRTKAAHSMWAGSPWISLEGAHADIPAHLGGPASNTRARNEALIRRREISVTSLSFLGHDRSHILLTASDASTSIRVWDIRGRYSLRSSVVPVSTTAEPDSHNRHRHFAINSLALGGDGSRLYALSKDNTVYTYATSHLILGSGPEPNSPAQPKTAPGPLYGFRHAKFHASSFYVKAALRKATDNHPELLAVGSTDKCPVLFPTDERFFKRGVHHEEADTEGLPEPRTPQSAPATPKSSPFARRGLLRTSSSSFLKDTIPIYESGTPLVEGHSAEVTSVAWARNGSLVTVGDDYRIRCWREGTQARELRIGGETEGRRWGCGWAVVDDGYDDEE